MFNTQVVASGFKSSGARSAAKCESNCRQSASASASSDEESDGEILTKFARGKTKQRQTGHQ
jgi:hypothetical protein